MDRIESDGTDLYFWKIEGLVLVLQYPSSFSHFSEPEEEFVTREIFVSENELDLINEYRNKKETIRYKISDNGLSFSEIEDN